MSGSQPKTAGRILQAQLDRLPELEWAITSSAELVDGRRARGRKRIGVSSVPSPSPRPLPWGFLLPTISCSFPMANLPHQRQVIEALEPAPERDRTGFAIALARQKAAQLCRPPYELAHGGRFSRRTALAKSHTPQRLPSQLAEPITGRCIR